MSRDESHIPKSKLEFDVQMTCENCANAVRTALSKIGIHDAEIDVPSQKVVVASQLPAKEVLDTIETSGKRAVLKGYGTINASTLENAVAELQGNNVMGVIRFTQATENACLIDGTIDGLTPGEHGLHIHEFGDLSQGCGGLGKHYNPYNMPHGGPDDVRRHAGDLGNVLADEAGRANFRFTNSAVKTWDIIGRSLSVSTNKDDYGQSGNEFGNSGPSLACAIIARSAGLFQNPKRICACDGVSVWDERDNPTAGESRGKVKNTSGL